GHGDQLAGELLRGADVDEALAVAEGGEHLVALRADGLVAGPGEEGGGLVGGDVGGGGSSFGDPLLARAVDELDVAGAVVVQVPVGVGREPVVAIAIEDDRVFVGDPARSEEGAERVRIEEVALDLVLQVELPVEADRAGDVRLGVQRGVLVDLDDADRGIAQVLLHPVGLDEHVLRIGEHCGYLRWWLGCRHRWSEDLLKPCTNPAMLVAWGSTRGRGSGSAVRPTSSWRGARRRFPAARGASSSPTSSSTAGARSVATS